jgi:branched-chain amino acid aminotransferase
VTQKIWLNGKLVAPGAANVSVYDHGLLYGDGVFEGIRCYGGRVLKFATHLRRLFDSARSIRLAIPYTPAQLDRATRQTIRACGRRDAYIRLCVTRGVGNLGLGPANCRTPSVFIIVDRINLYPPELYENGIPVITASTMRNHPASLSPRIKSLNYLNNILAKMEANDAGVPEAILLNHLGFVAEATADNIFIVARHTAPGGAGATPAVLTPPKHAGILEGVTRGLVLDLAYKAGLVVDTPDLTKHDLYTADEMFLTGTAAEVIPVTKIDGRIVGDGKPGPVTRQLMRAYHELVTQNAPED